MEVKLAEVVAFEDVKEKRTRTERPDGHFHTTTFIDHSLQRSEAPHVFMIESSPNRSLATHFHDVDQFQVVVAGSGSMGRHHLLPHVVHFARGFTPYGPLLSGPDEEGIAYVTLRARACPTGGAQRLPECRSRLTSISGRKPWQASGVPLFVSPGTNGVGLAEIPGIRDERGLAGHAVTLSSHASIELLQPAKGDGFCVVVLQGSLVHQRVSKAALTVVYVEPEEASYLMVAGPSGLQGLILNFPEPVNHMQENHNSSATPGSRVWQCELCSFSYDEAVGLPEEGFPPGTPWDAIPEDWVCPDCSATKKDFVLLDL